MTFTNQYKRVQLHPQSIVMLKKGHPWIIKDRFTEEFPHNVDFLVGQTKNQQDVCLFINDPKHPTIKGRLWSFFKHDTFNYELKQRVDEAIAKRKDISRERDHFYVVFGEADQLPGLFIRFVGPCLVMQYYSHFWHRYCKKLASDIRKDHASIKDVHIEERRIGKKPKIIMAAKKPEFKVTEFGVKYSIHLNRDKDYGLFTDMAQIRKKIQPELEQAQKVLNLFSYTGAYSLFALKCGAEVVHSIDLSSQNQAWEEENFELNQFTGELVQHTLAIDQALDKIKETFNFIICDPPSSSTDGNKKHNNFKEYERIIPALVQKLEQGGHLLVFLNTHNVSHKQFSQKIQEILKNCRAELSIEKRLKLNHDCPTLPNFPEGNYLKGLLLKKEN